MSHELRARETRRVAHSKIAQFVILEWDFSRCVVGRHTSPFALVVEISTALEKRTCGEFLNAAPPHRRRILRNRRETSPLLVQKTREKWGTRFRDALLADAERGNDGLIALGIVFLEIVQQTTALADQH